MAKPKNYDKEAVIKAALALPSLPESRMKLLDDAGKHFVAFKTGSTVYAPHIKTNDIDFCVNVPPSTFGQYAVNTSGQVVQADSFEQREGFNREYVEGGFTSLYANYEGQLINILCFGDYNLFEAWAYTTKALENLVHMTDIEVCDACYGGPTKGGFKEIMASKYKRVRLFNAFRDVFFEGPQIKSGKSPIELVNCRQCIQCERRADFFTTKQTRMEYKRTGLCERCQEDRAGLPVSTDF